MKNKEIDREVGIAAHHYAREGDYWLNRFSADLEKSFFLPDFQEKRPVEPMAQLPFRLAGELFSPLMKMSNHSDYTLHMILVAAIVVLLHKYTDSLDITVGTTIYRQASDQAFVNTVLPLRNRLTGDMTCKSLLIDVRQTIMEADENQNYPMESLLYQLGLTAQQQGFPLFDVVVLLDQIHDRRYIGHIPVNVLFCFSRQENGIAGVLEYNPGLYLESTARRILSLMTRVLAQMLGNLDGRVTEIDLKDEAEREKLLKDFNGRHQDYPAHKTLADLFSERVNAREDGLAVEYLDQKLTYRELHDRAGCLAANLRERGAGPDTVVALMVERSLEMAIGIMGVLAAGAAYLPINTALPPGRIDYMLRDSGAEIVITAHSPVEGGALAPIPFTTGQNCAQFCLRLHELRAFRNSVQHGPSLCKVKAEATRANATQGSVHRLPGDCCCAPRATSDLAYILYTSGSTGEPKAAMVEQRHVHNLLLGLYDRIYSHFMGPIKVALMAPYFFDASVKQIFGALLLGHCLSIVPEDTRLDGQALLDFYTGFQIDVSDGTPSHLRLLVESCIYSHFPFFVQRFIIGGEPLPKKLVEDFFAKSGSRPPVIINIYGVTECAVDTTAHDITRQNIADYPVCPIGRVLPNSSVYIVNRQNRLQPIGVAGELCIAGHSVGRGYLNNPELTAEKFVGGLYKTGDLARWLADGNLEFFGRIDHQVKVRGYRIELGEIESRLLRHPSIQAAVVLARTDKSGDASLCAYLVAQGGDGPAPGLVEADVREFLSRSLPDYMIPAHVVFLPKIPLTANGKVDRKALPAPETLIKGVYTPPRDALEEQLAGLWAEVLAIESARVGIDADFFELGGHSLKATILIARIHKRLDIRVPLAEMFIDPTIRGMAGFIREHRQKMYEPIPTVEKKEYYPLSPATRRLYFEQVLDPGNTNYNMTMSAWLTGHLEPGKLDQVFQRLSQRHETLRTALLLVDDEPVQRVFDQVNLVIERHHASDRQQAAAIIEHFVTPFHLSRAPLFRVCLIKTAPQEHILAVGVHHIVADGTSLGLILKDFMALYSGAELPDLRIQYKDYSVWKNSRKQQDLRQKQERYWLEQFREEVPILDLPSDFPRPPVKSSRGRAIISPLSSEESDRIRALALSAGATPYMVLLALFHVLLAKLTGLEDTVVGTPSAGRDHVDLEPLVGMFVNTLAMRNFPRHERDFDDFLQDVKHRTIEAFANQDYDFEDLVRAVATEKDISRSPIFDGFMALQNMEMPEVSIPGLRLRAYPYDRQVARFDLSFIIQEGGGQFWIYAEYCLDLFNAATVERFSAFFRRLAASVSEDPKQALADLDIISPEEREQVLVAFNDNSSDYPREKTISEIFSEQVAKAPSRIALVSDQHLSYRELERQAGLLAGELLKRGVKPNMPVGLRLGRSIEMIIGILGILYAGGAYLPLDPELPPERLDYMLADSGAEIIITAHSPVVGGAYAPIPFTTGQNCAQFCLRLHELRTFRNSVQHARSGDCCCAPRATSDLAYIMYTSGTSGRPRGVLVQHKNVVRLVMNTNYVGLSQETRLLLTGAPAFDATTFEIWGPLLHGGRLVLVSGEVIMDAERLARALKRECIDTMWLSASLFNQLLDQDERMFSGLEWLLVGGDVLSPAHIGRVRRTGPKLHVVNGYGPTENTTFSLCYRVDRDFDGRIPIGGPIANTTAYVLDRQGRVQPVGVPGEIYLAGDGLARGYLNNPELTAEKFVGADIAIGAGLSQQSPLTPHHSPLTNRLYRTGDLGRWLPGGVIEFIGRIDQQIKLRGFRVEPGEIEGRLMRHPQVKEAVVLALKQPGGDKALCAYVVSQAGQTPEKEVMREFLAIDLPDYMVPAHFVLLDKIPLTANGKLDKRALPQPEVKAGKGFVSPRTAREGKLADLWSQVLNVGPIGIDDNFFELGGHSLKATLIVSRIQRLFGVNLQLLEFFKHPTIRRLSDYLAGAGQESESRIEPAEKRDYYPLSSAQARLYFLHTLSPQSVTYNIPVSLGLSGRIEAGAVQRVFQTLIRRHESLRTAFTVIDGEPVQRVLDKVGFELEVFGAAGRDGRSGHSGQELIENIIRGFIRPFDLGRAPLLRVGLYQVAETEHLFMIDMPHIVTDGFSMLILVNECLALYQGDGSDSLPRLSIQYKDFAVWQRSGAQRQRLEAQQTYWLERFKGPLPLLNLASDFPRPDIQGQAGAYTHFEIPAPAAANLRALAIREEASLFMVMLAIFYVLLHKLTGQEDIIVGTVTAGRSRQDLEGVVGMFVNTLALRSYPRPGQSFLGFLQDVRQESLRAFDNQDFPFDDLVDRVLEKRYPGRNPLFDVLFMFGQLDVVHAPQALADSVKNPAANLQVKPLAGSGTPAKFDLLVSGSDNGEKMVFSVGYCTDLFKEETVAAFGSLFVEIVARVSADETALIKDMALSHDLVTARDDASYAQATDFEF